MATAQTPTDEWETKEGGIGTQWKPQAKGDNIAGTYSGSQVLTDNEGREFTKYTLDVNGEMYAILSSFIIDRAFTGIQKGQEVRVEFLGTRDLSGGRTLNDYKVQVRKG
jgi:hypothetical protein